MTPQVLTVFPEASSPIYFPKGENWTYVEEEISSTYKTTVWEEGGICGVIKYLFSMLVWIPMACLDLADGFNPTWTITHRLSRIIENYTSSPETRKISDESAAKLAYRLSPTGSDRETVEKIAERIQGSNVYSGGFGKGKKIEYRKNPMIRVVREYLDGVATDSYIESHTKTFNGLRTHFTKSIGKHTPAKYSCVEEMQNQMSKRGESGGIPFYLGYSDAGLPRKVAVAACRELSRTGITAENLTYVVRYLNREMTDERSLFAGRAGKINLVMDGSDQAGVSISLGRPTQRQFPREILSVMKQKWFKDCDVRLKVDERADGEVVVSILSIPKSKRLLAKELKDGMTVYSDQPLGEEAVNEIVSEMRKASAISKDELEGVYAHLAQSDFGLDGKMAVTTLYSLDGKKRLGVEFSSGADISEEREEAIKGMIGEGMFASGGVEVVFERSQSGQLVLRLQDRERAAKMAKAKASRGVKGPAYKRPKRGDGAGTATSPRKAHTDIGRENKRAQAKRDIEFLHSVGTL